MTLTLHEEELAVHDTAIRLETSELVVSLREILGAQLVAYVGGVGDTRTVRQWAEGERDPRQSALKRLRLAYRAASLVSRRDSRGVAQAWFQGLNPMLGDVSPARVLRDNDPDEVGAKVLAASRAFAGAA